MIQFDEYFSDGLKPPTSDGWYEMRWFFHLVSCSPICPWEIWHNLTRSQSVLKPPVIYMGRIMMKDEKNSCHDVVLVSVSVLMWMLLLMVQTSGDFHLGCIRPCKQSDIYHISNPLTSLILLMVQTEIPNNRLGKPWNPGKSWDKKTFPSPGASTVSLDPQVVSWIPTSLAVKKPIAKALPDKKDFINESLGSVWQVSNESVMWKFSKWPNPWECRVGNMGSFFFFPQSSGKENGFLFVFFLGWGGCDQTWC